MSNHYHMVLRNRPDLVKQLSDREVISRWWRLTNYRAKASPEVKEQLMQRWLADREMIFKLRKRLSSISWMMSSLAQPIAVAANREDEVSGRFWQGRFDCWRIQTLQHLLSAMMYVDLNPIRAGMAKSLERSRYTSICRRIKSFKRRKKVAAHSSRPGRASGSRVAR